MTESSAADDQHYSGTDEVFCRGFVSHIDNVNYDEHVDRTQAYFFTPGSENETKFLKYVSGESSEYPISDDRDSLAGMKCNIYSIDPGSPRWSNIIRIMDSVTFFVEKGMFITIRMTGSSGETFIIVKDGENIHEVTNWTYGSDYPTTSSEDMTVSVLPNNPGFNGDQITLENLFTTASYDIDVSSSPPSYSNNTVLAVVFYVIAAIGVAAIVMSIRKPAWAKVPKDRTPKKGSSDKDDE